jgi:hypothetical protein
MEHDLLIKLTSARQSINLDVPLHDKVVEVLLLDYLISGGSDVIVFVNIKNLEFFPNTASTNVPIAPYNALVLFNATGAQAVDERVVGRLNRQSAFGQTEVVSTNETGAPATFSTCYIHLRVREVPTVR